MFVAAIATMWAEEVVFDFTNPTALTPSVTPKELAAGASSGDGEIVSDKTFTNGSVSFSMTDPANAQDSQKAKIWTNTNGKIELRVYKNSTFTISSSKTITSILVKGDYAGGLSVDGTALTAIETAGTKVLSAEWTGSSNKVEVAVKGGTHKFNTITVTLSDEDGGGVVEPEVPAEPTTLWSEPFDASQGAFTIKNAVKPEGVTDVWTWAGEKYGMKATAYINKTNYATEAWLISPVIDLTNATETKLTFSHCGNYFADGAISTEVSLVACEVGGSWEKVAIDNYPAGNNWTFVDATADIASYAGKKMQFAYVYTSTADAAGTWEVKNVQLIGKGTAVVEEPEVVIPVYTSIADIKAAATTSKTAVSYEFRNLLVTGVATVGGKTSVYVSDDKDGLLFYGDNTTTFRKGEKITGKITGSLVLYNGLTEIADADYSEAQMVSKNNDVVAKVLTIADLGTDNGVKVYENMLVKLEGVSFLADKLSSKNITIADDSDNEITLRDNFGVLGDFIFDQTKTYNVTAFVSSYKGTPQLYPLTADHIEMITNLSDPETAWAAEEKVILAGEEWKVENTLTTKTTADITYTSSDEAVATVAADGTITVNGYGFATITAETAENSEYLASKASFKLYVIEGKGTLEAPYTAADAQYYLGKLTDKVWVKGTIVGYWKDNKFVEGAEGAAASNLALGTAACNLPVQLSSGTFVREDLNLKDNADMLGKEVTLFGKIEKYFGVSGLKNVTDYSIDGVTGIESVETNNLPAVIYTIDGRRIAAPVKGINIINGKKVLVK